MAESEFPHSIVLIDDDDSMLELMKHAAEAMSIASVNTFNDGKLASDYLTNHRPEFVILDWKLPNVSGLALFNRIRMIPELVDVPVLIISGYIKARDFTLLDELPFAGLVEKPFTQAFLVRRVKDLSRDWRWFQSEKLAIEKALNFSGKETAKTLATVIALIDSAPRPIPIGIATARVLAKQGNLKEAEKVLRKVLQIEPECLSALTELGKIMLQTKRFSEGAVFLRNAQKLSPDNLERLCLLGDMSMQTLDSEQAHKYFERALEIDGGCVEAEAGMTLATNLENYLSRSNVTKIPSNFASLLNAVGISLVRTEQYDKGIEHYHSALSYLKDPRLRAKLAFNLGLGYLRWRKPPDAARWFSEAVQLSGGAHAKSQMFLEKLRREGVSPSLGSNSSLNLPDMTGHDTPTPSEQDFDLQESPPAQPKVRLEPLKVVGGTDAVATGPQADYDSLKGVFMNLRFPDDGLFSKTGQQSKASRYTAYPAELQGNRIAVFMPMILSPKTASVMTEAQAEKMQVFVMRLNGTAWERFWPVPKLAA